MLKAKLESNVMNSEKKSKLLILLVGIFVVLAVTRTIFWLSEENESRVALPQPNIQVGNADKPSAKEQEASSNPGFKEGEFTLKVNRPLNDETIVRYIVPVDASGKPLPSASNIVFYAPYNGDAGRIKEGLWPWHRHFAETLGFTVFSLTIEANTDIVNDHEQYYIYKEAGWFEIILKIQERLTNEFKLTPKPLLIVGQSSGGSMAQQMAVAYPDKIDAVAWCGGATYDQVGANSNVAWLAISTWGCYGVPTTRQFKKQAASAGKQVLRGEAPPDWKTVGGTYFHHAASDTTCKLMQTFIRDIVKLREQNNGKVPPPEKWPVVADICGERRYFPSEEFAALWQQLPHAVTKQLEGEYSPAEEFAAFPHSDKADRIVLYAGETESEVILPMDNLYFLANESTIPLSFKLSNDYLNDFERIKKALNNIIAKEEWKNLPVYVIGTGTGGQILASAALTNGSKRIVRITTFNSDYEHPFEQLSIAAHRKGSNIPLKMYLEKSKASPDTTMPNTNIVKVNAAELTGTKWFTLLAAAIR